MSYDEDDADMVLVAQSDQVAFERLVLRHQSRLVGWLRQSLVNDAEDIAQECFVKVYLQAKFYQPRGQFKSWLMRMAKNQSVDFVRRSKSRNRHKCTVGLPFGAFDISDECDPVASASEREMLEMAEEYMATIPRDQADSLRCYAEGYTLPEIAEMAGTGLPTTKSRVRLGRRKMRDRRVETRLSAFARQLAEEFELV